MPICSSLLVPGRPSHTTLKRAFLCLYCTPTISSMGINTRTPPSRAPEWFTLSVCAIWWNGLPVVSTPQMRTGNTSFKRSVFRLPINYRCTAGEAEPHIAPVWVGLQVTFEYDFDSQPDSAGNGHLARFGGTSALPLTFSNKLKSMLSRICHS